MDRSFAEARSLFNAGRLLRSKAVLDDVRTACPARADETLPLLLPIAAALSLSSVQDIARYATADTSLDKDTRRLAEQVISGFASTKESVLINLRLKAVHIEPPEKTKEDAWKRAYDAERVGDYLAAYEAYLSAAMNTESRISAALVGAALAAQKTGAVAKSRALYEIALGNGDLELVSSPLHGNGLTASPDGRFIGVNVVRAPWNTQASSGFVIASLETGREYLMFDGWAKGAQFGDDGIEIAIPFPISFATSGDAYVVNVLSADSESVELDMFAGPDEVAFLPTDRMLWTGSQGFVLLDRAKKKEVYSQIKEFGFGAIGIAANSRYVAFEYKRGTSDLDDERTQAAIYDLKRERVTANWPAASGSFYFSDDGAFLVELTKPSVKPVNRHRIVETATGKERFLKSNLESVDITRIDNRHLYFWKSDKGGELRDLPTGRLLARSDKSSGILDCKLPLPICSLPPPRLKLIGGRSEIGPCARVVALPFEHGFGSATSSLQISDVDGLVAEWNPEGTIFVVLERDQGELRARVVEASSGSVLVDLPTTSDEIPRFMAEGRALAVEDTPTQGSSVLLDTATWKKRIVTEDRPGIESYFLEAKKGRIAYRSPSDGAAVLLDMNKGGEKRIAPGYVSLGKAVWEPQAGLVGVHESNRVRLWSLSEERLVHDIVYAGSKWIGLDAFSVALPGKVPSRDQKHGAKVVQTNRDVPIFMDADHPAFVTNDGMTRLFATCDVNRRIGQSCRERDASVCLFRTGGKACERLWSDSEPLALSSDGRHALIREIHRPQVDDIFRNKRERKEPASIVDLTTFNTIAKIPGGFDEVVFAMNNRAIWTLNGNTVSLYRMELGKANEMALVPVVELFLTGKGMIARNHERHFEFFGDAMNKLRPMLRCRSNLVIGPPEACEDAVIESGLLRKAIAVLEGN